MLKIKQKTNLLYNWEDLPYSKILILYLNYLWSFFTYKHQALLQHYKSNVTHLQAWYATVRTIYAVNPLWNDAMQGWLANKCNTLLRTGGLPCLLVISLKLIRPVPYKNCMQGPGACRKIMGVGLHPYPHIVSNYISQLKFIFHHPPTYFQKL